MTQMPFFQDDDPPALTPKKRQLQPAISVTEAAALVKEVLAVSIPGKIRIVGEISNLSNRTHWFFSIKDQGAALRCVCFASNAKRINFPVRDGMEVIITGRVDFFEGQGSLQIYVDSMEQVGIGSLEQQLQAMIEELRELGYLDVDRKKPIPTMCQKIAVVTSRSAAALQDVINTAHKRWPGCELLHFDVRVQGENAAPEIARALRLISEQGSDLGIDAIILTRGGGSIEDLWAFNERIVADAVFDCDIPIVAAIGHETDTTVAELVADMRCATPTQAAMTLVPDRQALDHQISQMTSRLKMSLKRQSQLANQRLTAISRHRLFTRPQSILELPTQRLERVKERLPRLIQRKVDQDQQFVKSLARTLNAVGPKRVLERGFSYTTDAKGKLVKSVNDVKNGDAMVTVLADGKVKSIVAPPGSSPEFNKPKRRKTKRQDSDAGQPSLFGD